MKITSAIFKKGLKGEDSILDDGVPQVAFIGRSNAGKSSAINSLTKVKNLARTSSFPGRTQEINVFMINNALYLVDLPGYGFAKASRESSIQMNKLVYWYLFESCFDAKVVPIIDASIGPTESDMGMLQSLREKGSEIIVVANKIDKIKKSEYKKQMELIEKEMIGHKVIPFSSKTKIGIGELAEDIFK